MERHAFAVAAALVACHTSVDPPAPRERARPIALDLAELSPPFDVPPIANAFAVARRIRSVTWHQVARLDGQRYVGGAHRVDDYDTAGEITRRTGRLESDDDWVEDVGAVHDLAGRVTRRVTRNPAGVTSETDTYDAAGRLVHLDDVVERRGGGTERGEERRSYDPSGRLVRRTRGPTGEAPYLTLDYQYDEAGKLVACRGSSPDNADDRYTFGYDSTGQVASVRFVERGKPIYERAFTYDADGFVATIQLTSSVPALGNELLAVTYQLTDGSARAPVVIVPAPGSGELLPLPPGARDPAMLADPIVYVADGPCALRELAIGASGELTGLCEHGRVMEWAPATRVGKCTEGGDGERIFAIAAEGRRARVDDVTLHVASAVDPDHPLCRLDLADISIGRWSSDGTWLVMGGLETVDGGPEYGIVEIVDRAGKVHHSWHAADVVQALAVSPDGSQLAVGGAPIQVWTIGATPRLVASIPGGGDTDYVGFADSHTLITATGAGGLQIWTLGSAPTARTLTPGSRIVGVVDAVNAADVAGDTLVTGHASGTVRVWSLATGHERGHAQRRSDPVTAVAIAPDRQSVVTADGGGTALRWQLPATDR